MCREHGEEGGNRAVTRAANRALVSRLLVVLFGAVCRGGVRVMHGARHVIRGRRTMRRRRLVMAVSRRRGHTCLMRQTACPRHEGGQRRCLEQDPRARKKSNVPAEERHRIVTSLSKRGRTRKWRIGAETIETHRSCQLVRPRFLGKRLRPPRHWAGQRKCLREKWLLRLAYSTTIRPLKIGSFSFVWS